jgi:hypothetical protein
MSKRLASVAVAMGLSWTSGALAQEGKGLWGVYDRSLKGAKYIDLTHVIAPNIPVWYGFGPSKFEPTEAPIDIDGLARKGDAYTYPKHGFEATHSRGSTGSFPRARSSSSAPTGRRPGPIPSWPPAGPSPACRSTR